jgi:hypothetical protein
MGMSIWVGAPATGWVTTWMRPRELVSPTEGGSHEYWVEPVASENWKERLSGEGFRAAKAEEVAVRDRIAMENAVARRSDLRKIKYNIQLLYV